MKKENLLFKKILKIFIYIILPLILIFALFNSNLTGFSINSEPNQTSTATIVLGSFLGIIIFFFIVALIISKLRTKTYKPHKSKK